MERPIGVIPPDEDDDEWAVEVEAEAEAEAFGWAAPAGAFEAAGAAAAGAAEAAGAGALAPFFLSAIVYGFRGECEKRGGGVGMRPGNPIPSKKSKPEKEEKKEKKREKKKRDEKYWEWNRDREMKMSPETSKVSLMW